VRGPSPVSAIVGFVSGALTCGPDPSRGQEGGGSTELFAAVSFGRSRPGAPLTDTFSVPRMRTSLGPSRTSGSLHRTASTSDILVVTPRHARSTSVPTDPLSAPHCAPLRETRFVELRLTFEPKDLTSTCP